MREVRVRVRVDGEVLHVTPSPTLTLTLTLTLQVTLRGLSPAKLKTARAEVDVLRLLHHPYLISYRGAHLDNAR